MRFPGSSMLAAVKAIPAPRSAPRWHTRCDAALEGTPTPGLGGSFHFLWWRFSLEGVLLTLPIVHHEAMAYGVNLLMFKGELEAAPRVYGLADATATKHLVADGAHRDGTQFLAEGINTLTFSQQLANKLEHDHGFGASNGISDYASRGKIGALEQLGAQMGLDMQRRDITQEALDFLAYMYGGLLIIARRSPSELPPSLRTTWNAHASSSPSSATS